MGGGLAQQLICSQSYQAPGPPIDIHGLIHASWGMGQPALADPNRLFLKIGGWLCGSGRKLPTQRLKKKPDPNHRDCFWLPRLSPRGSVGRGLVPTIRLAEASGGGAPQPPPLSQPLSPLPLSCTFVPGFFLRPMGAGQHCPSPEQGRGLAPRTSLPLITFLPPFAQASLL